MSYSQSDSSLGHRAVLDFQAARRKAALEGLLARLSGKPSDLLSYDQVRKQMPLLESSLRKLEEIPLHAIVGSVNRYTDFTRNFLPRNEADLSRWARVRAGVESLQGLPPIEVYKVGEAYFVLDGHHRVSVARELGAKTIQGYVSNVATRVPLSPGDRPDDIIIKAEYADFLSKTRIDELRPGANLMLTAPGQYPKLLDHISVHKYLLGTRYHREVPYEEAVTDWHDSVYLPIVELIRERNLLRDFPGRSETDLYIWIVEHSAALGGGLGWEVRPERAAEDLRARYSPLPEKRVPRLVRKLADLLVPSEFETGPQPGFWRSEHAAPHRGDHIFDDLLVTVPGGNKGWPAVDMAIEVARREEARLTGLHVLQPGQSTSGTEIQALEETFSRRCEAAGVSGRLLIESGEIHEMICQRSPWVDLVVFRLAFPPPLRTLQRLRSGARMLIRRCSSPILAVPEAPFHLEAPLLAYGPGRKADEALYMATYVAANWHLPLTVVTVNQDGSDKSSKLLDQARDYLQTHGVEATYVQENGDPARAVLLCAEKFNAGLLITGGYESGPLLESLFGSTLDHILRSTRRPVLICR